MNLEKKRLFDAMHKGVSRALEKLFSEKAKYCETMENGHGLPEGLWACLQILKPFFGKFTLCMPMDLVCDLEKLNPSTSGNGEDNDKNSLDECFLEEEKAEAQKVAAQKKDSEVVVYETLGGTLSDFAEGLLTRLLEEIVPQDLEFDAGHPYTGSGLPDTQAACVCRYTLNGFSFWMAFESQETAHWKGIAPYRPLN